MDTLVRALPKRTEPVDGEALDSWLEATSHRLSCTWGDLTEAIGLTTTGGTTACDDLGPLRRNRPADPPGCPGSRPDIPVDTHSVLPLLPALPTGHWRPLATVLAGRLGVRLPTASVPAGRRVPAVWAAPTRTQSSRRADSRTRMLRTARSRSDRPGAPALRC
jgi:hypothetical protein